MWEEIWPTLLGGSLALFGSFVAIKIQMSNVLRIKMDEELAKRKIEVNARAYSNIKRVEGALIQQTLEDTSKITAELEQWVFDNRLFLPSDYFENWLTMRTNIPILARRERGGTETDYLKVHKRVHESVSACIDAVYKDMNIERGDWERIST